MEQETTFPTLSHGHLKAEKTGKYSGVIEGSEPDFIYNISQTKNRKILCIVQNEKIATQIESELSFYFEESSITLFPSYDCLPYDNISPNHKIISKRILALYKLANGSSNITIVTLNSLMQKLIPKDKLLSHIMCLEKNTKIEHKTLISTLIENGYTRVETANEPGHFAVRGGIIDVIDLFTNDGFRIDFFGNNIEKIRVFDPFSQISSKEVEKILILPASEIIFSAESINQFCENFEKYGNNQNDIFESVTNKRHFQSMEHFLPLFYKKLSNFFDYLNNDTIILNFTNFDHGIEDYEKSINDHYLAKTNHYRMLENLKPVEKNLMFLCQNELRNFIYSYENYYISPFQDDTESNRKNYQLLPNLKHKSEINNTPIVKEIKDLQSEHKKKIIITLITNGSLERVKNLFSNNEIHHVKIENFSDSKKFNSKSICLGIANLHKGFIGEDHIIITENDLFAEKLNKKAKSAKRLENFFSEAASFNPGEFVIHANHGVGRFDGIATLDVVGNKHDFLQVTYDNNDKLFVPVENIELLTRLSDDQDSVKLDKLGSRNWQERKSKIKNRIKEIAVSLLKMAAERELRSAQIIEPIQNLYSDFCARFQYIETEDQLRAISDVEEDFASGKPTDRLICGDVGFGKTEIALRAAFMVSHNNAGVIPFSKLNQTNDFKSEARGAYTNVGEHGESCKNRLDHPKLGIGIKSQIAVVTPTTILCKQHYETFKKRFEGFGVNIKELSRLTSTKDAKSTKNGLADGTVDIVIGTHALFSSSVKFNNLQLLIIDEEQHFGVAQKEKLKELRTNIHVLTLSATPIPRTMQMSMVGIKELSLIATPPIDRLAVKTYIMSMDEVTVREAILREYHRHGKCFFVAPRISYLEEIKKLLDKILPPEIKSVVAHGQMKATDIDDIMYDFYSGKFSILISTTIIESGLDVPFANTIFIYRADMLGLSALYQLRGRVGRGTIQGYSYLLLPPRKNLSAIAKSRLEVLQSLDSLGVGFSVASHDMDIRGFGNLLGEEQSGHIKEVGVELYQAMLQDCSNELKNQTFEENSSWSPQINLGIPVLIPDSYISEPHLRMGIYRRFAKLETISEVDEFAAEIFDRFGAYGIEVEHLLLTIKLKILAKAENIEKLDLGDKGLLIGFRNNFFAKTDKLLQILPDRSDIKLRSDQKIIFMRSFQDPQKRIKFAFDMLDFLKKL